jgi:hypothetical protein
MACDENFVGWGAGKRWKVNPISRCRMRFSEESGFLLDCLNRDSLLFFSNAQRGCYPDHEQGISGV